MKIKLSLWLTLGLIPLLLIGCQPPALSPAPLSPSPSATSQTPARLPAPKASALTPEEVATLESLRLVNDHPLYTMVYQGPYETLDATLDWVQLAPSPAAAPSAWACSLFAALHDPDGLVYGRNFDWVFSPAILLFTNPGDGYASLSMVDFAYLGFDGPRAGGLLDLPLAELAPLLAAPGLPFDGMNEAGLAVGMAAVQAGGMRPDPEKETIGSLLVIREMLDHAGNIDEAVDILAAYNIETQGGPPLHYLIADRSGRAVLVEFYQGEMIIQPNENPWHQATNFIRAATGDDASGQCWRYDNLTTRLEETGGRLLPNHAMNLLESVAQPNTQWSVVYEIRHGKVSVVMGQQYEQVHQFDLAEFR